ncbi:MAG TPA: hypothetical protein VMY34_07725 [Acidimicrobiales bacterium]|nr:hypothetical protein [Acidimicrobiales bacterium]
MARTHVLARAAALGILTATAWPSSTPPAAAAEVLTIAAADVDGVMTTTVLQADHVYEVMVSGLIDYDNDLAGDQLADGECTIRSDKPGILGSPPLGQLPIDRYQRHRYAFYETDPTKLIGRDLYDPDPQDDSTDLYLDGRNVEWLPSSPTTTTPLGCDSGHSYSTLFVPTEDGSINARVFDIYYLDNSGSLTVTITDLGLTSTIAQAPHRETSLLHARVATDVFTTPLDTGTRYALVARGLWTYKAGGYGLQNFADAECSRTQSDGSYKRDRFGPTALDVLVDGLDVDWQPLVGLPTGCASPLHYYVTTVVGTGAPVALRVSDPGVYTDNSGTLAVDVYELP